MISNQSHLMFLLLQPASPRQVEVPWQHPCDISVEASPLTGTGSSTPAAQPCPGGDQATALTQPHFNPVIHCAIFATSVFELHFGPF